MTLEIVLEIVKSGGVIGILGLGIYYFLKKEKAYKEEIKELHDERKEERKELVVLIFKVAAFMEKGDKNFHDLKDFLVREFDNVKKDING